MSSRKRSTKKRKKSKTTRLTISPGVLAWASVLFCLFVISGGFYNILENPPPYWPYESVFVFLSNASMFLGLWLSYRSTQIAYDRDKANRRLLLGIVFAAAGLLGNYLIYEMKKTVLG